MKNLISKPINLLMSIFNSITRPIVMLCEKLFGGLVDYLLNKLNITQTGYFDDYFKNHKDHLLAGRLEKAALEMYPQDRFPTFYKKIPADIRKPIVVDGRIRNSSYLPAYTLPPGYISNELIEDSKNEALRLSILTFVISSILLLLVTAVFVFFPLLQVSLPEYQSPDVIDNWFGHDVDTGLTFDKVWFYTSTFVVMLFKILISGAISTAIFTSSILLCTLSLSSLVFWGSWRNLIFKSMNDHAEPLRVETKESIVRWKHRFEQRELEEQAYLSQITEIERLCEREDEAIKIGEATGHFSFRGLLTGPKQGQSVKVAVSDLFQNTIILGGTGSGKTRSLLLPVVKQLINLQNKRDISLYVTDAKAVLWKDVAKIAKQLNKNVQVIGVHDNEMGVDLLDGISPSFAADLIKSVMRQLGGASSDSFWPDMANNSIRHVLNVLRAWERTDGGIAYAEKTGERPYSLVSAYRLALNASKVDGWMKDIEADILNCVDNQYSYIADLAKQDLYASLSYLRDVWPNMAKDTRSGIEANITNALGGFEADNRLREKFASGEKSDITVNDFWGSKITCVNLPEVELGNAGKIVNVFLKTLLFNAANKRQSADPDIREKQQLAFIADEYQSLITADISGMSDATFPNISRSTGVFYVAATQGVVGLQQAIGENATQNFLNNMRNKIFLQIEEVETMNFAKMLAGKTLRFYSYNGTHNESYESMRREVGFDPALLGAAKLKDRAGLFAGLFNASNKFELSDVSKIYKERDFSNGLIQRAAGHSNDLAHAERNRVEDKNSDYMKSGNEMSDVLYDSDLIQMGRTHAYCFVWRSGHSRQDIVKLTDISQLV